MTGTKALDVLADRHGILKSYHDMSGREQTISPDTQKALLRANGLQLDNDAMVREALSSLAAEDTARRFPSEMVVNAGVPVALDLPENSDWQLRIEGSELETAEGRGHECVYLPPLSGGVHELTVQSGAHYDRVTLIAAPRAAPSIEDLTGQTRLWGLNAALYAMRSGRNFGLGDFEDLARAAEAVAAHGAGYLGVNPIHALGWCDAGTISPYSPTHRAFLNTSHIAPDCIRGLETSRKAQALLADRQIEFSGVRVTDIIDYTAFRKPFAKLLEAMFDIFLTEAGGNARENFSAFRDNGGSTLCEFALFESLGEDHGPDWRDWPEEVRAPDHSGARAAGRERAERMQFHAWLQWVAATQVSDAQTRAIQAGAPLGLYLDLAVGPRRGAAETWCEGDSIAQGVSVGAPPDHLSPAGQNWNLAAYSPRKLAQNRYGAFRKVLRETMRNAGVVRIDHVLGTNRSFWVPDDGSPGGYIRQPFQSMLAIIAIEADRTRTAVVGEDLGLVPEGFREAINARGLYSYSVLQYEKASNGQFRSPASLPSRSLACFGTHDTPTMNGFRLGRDIDWWQRLGWIDKEQSEAARRKRNEDVDALRLLAGTSADDAKETDLSCSVHTALARSEVAMVSVQLDDLVGESEAQNLPGTIDEHPNWRRRSAVQVESFDDWPALAETGQMMMDYERSPRRDRKKK